MNTYFFDASALVKRYLTEIGSKWVQTLIDSSAEDVVAVAEITRVEVAAALAARHRAPGGLSLRHRDQSVALLLKHFDLEYQITALDSLTIARAVELTQNHRLRGYDAVQLATALAANHALIALGLPPLVFVAADNDLLAAAQLEGLAIENPLLYA
jgi:predicted nucleic acid-binding protein